MKYTLTEDIDRLDGVAPLLATLCSITGLAAAGIAQGGIVRRIHAIDDAGLPVGDALPADVTLTIALPLTQADETVTLFGMGTADTAQATRIFELGAKQLALQLEALKKEHALHQFMHDLRNPVGAMSNGAGLLARLPLDERSKSIAAMIQECTNTIIQMLEGLRKQH